MPIDLSPFFPAIASVTVAFIGGGVAFISSVLSKELKTSEFRYAWLNSVLDDIAKFTGAAESTGVAAWGHLANGGEEKARAFIASAEPQIREMLSAYYRARIRLYPDEHPHVLGTLERLKALVLSSDVPDPVKVDAAIVEVVQASHEALKAQWHRVKAGEVTFRWTKYVSFGFFLLTGVAFVAFGIYAVYKALGY